MITASRTARVSSVEALEGFRLRLGFSDGPTREVDLEAEVRSRKRGHWGIPKEFSAEEIRRWIVDVVALPSGAESPR